MDDKALIDAELEQLELEQRQLDLDRKRLELRLRHARLNGHVDAVPRESQLQSRPESVDGATGVERVTAGGENFSNPGREEATDAPTAGNQHIARVFPPSDLVDISGWFSRQYHEEAAASRDRVTKPSPSPGLPHSSIASTQPSVSTRPESTVPSSATLPKYPSSSQTPPSTISLSGQQDSFGQVPASSHHKRERSSGSEVVPEQASTPEINDGRNWTINKQAPGKRNKQSPKVQGLPDHHIQAIIRKYGERLVQRHMRCFRKHERREAAMIIEAGSKVVDGLLERKFRSLEELHAAYERQIRRCCTWDLQQSLRSELHKFRRAGPIWWSRCVTKRTQEERLQDVATVFQDVVEGIFDNK
ncbi:uncharacterized protein Z520_07411 [Fonsecaea multimorphosa CBS 102226]|uniref:Uncharacterized protein n=1 Tax=Fonsecaea multimorphosa CBS 102226 TaxID=1442371 RepID=A0A0D2JT86_9EURO|nr:uncharacterized protein Z520_07411 [Fonsecaea multimorphosa CBS 102226]KIX96692.1 hypothetical protein Z520_07411 [Fonsecaea multimorphosa CBS 102226]OAL22747.1 hypothetical protein AYO22_06929 [Fonsecaea multimorphosa]